MAEDRFEPRRWQRLLQRIAASRPGSWFFSYTLHHVDRVLLRLSGGRVSLPGVLAGFPVVRLTTTGAKTGTERTLPVLGYPDGEKWVLVASNFGRADHPAWYRNLTATPEVELTSEDETEGYVARDATEEEWTEYWDRVTDLYVGFEPYQRRSGDRHIPIVVLEPREERTGRAARG